MPTPNEPPHPAKSATPASPSPQAPQAQHGTHIAHSAQFAPIPDPLHPEDVAEAYAQVMVRNEERSRAKLAATNRANKIPEPRVGAKLFVSTARGIPRRGRGGVQFVAGAKREVEVVDLEPEDLARRHELGEGVVSVHGAEEILADTSLVVHTTGGPLIDPATHDALAAENAELRAKLAAAMRNAPPDPGDGSSSRLKAAAKAREDEPEFGHRTPPGK